MPRLLPMTLLSLALGLSLGCLKPACSVSNQASAREAQAWLGAVPAGLSLSSKPVLLEDFRQAKLYFPPLVLTSLDGPGCQAVKAEWAPTLTAIARNAFELQLPKCVLVATEAEADYVVAGRLVSIEKYSLVQHLGLGLGWLAAFGPNDRCTWWFKVTRRDTGRVVLAYELFDWAPSITNMARTFEAMADRIHRAPAPASDMK